MRKKILLIEDDGIVLRSVTSLLESQGYEVSGYKNGVAAVQAFKDQKFDLIITDIRMPGQDGIKTAKLIRHLEKEQQLPKTPLIIITGYASEEVPLEAIELGVCGYVLKPFDLDRFIIAVKKALGEEHGSRDLDSDVQKACSKLKELILDFHNRNEKAIFSDKNLRDFMSELEKRVTQIEREIVRKS